MPEICTKFFIQSCKDIIQLDLEACVAAYGTLYAHGMEHHENFPQDITFQFGEDKPVDWYHAVIVCILQIEMED